MSDMKERYSFVTNNEENWQCIGIKGGRFQGVVYKYGKVSVPEKENEKGDLPLKFEYDIVDTNGLPDEFFTEDFHELIGDILVDILDEQLNKGTLQYATND